MHSRCSALPFSLFDFASRRRTLSLQTLRACPPGVCVALRASLSLQLAGHPRGSCMPCKIMHVFTAQLAFGLCGLLKRAASIVLCNMVTACNNFLGFVPLLSCFRPQTRQKLHGSLNHARHCVQYVSGDDYSGACFSAQLIIILLISGIFPATPAPSLRTL